MEKQTETARIPLTYKGDNIENVSARGWALVDKEDEWRLLQHSWYLDKPETVEGTEAISLKELMEMDIPDPGIPYTLIDNKNVFMPTLVMEDYAWQLLSYKPIWNYTKKNIELCVNAKFVDGKTVYLATIRIKGKKFFIASGETKKEAFKKRGAEIKKMGNRITE